MTTPNLKHSRRGVWIVTILAIALGGCAGSEKAVIPAGTMLVATLNEPLSTDYHRAGDPFLATIREPLQVDDETVIAAGATVRGQITNVDPGTAGGAPPSLTLLCNEIALESGRMLTVTTNPVVIEGTPVIASPTDPTAAPDATVPVEPAPPAPAERPAGEADSTEAATTIPDPGQLTLSPGHEIRIEIVAPAEVVLVTS